MSDKALTLLFALSCAASSALASDAMPAQPAPAYRLTKSVVLGAPDRWDALTFDPASGRVYIAHGDRVTVVDGKSGAILGNVEGFPGGTHDIAIVADEGRGYTDDGEAGIAASFDLKTLKVVHRIKAEPDADGMLFDPSSHHVFVIDGDSGKLTVIDPKTDDVVATIDGGGGLEFGVSGVNGKVYVNGAAKGEIVRIDVATNKVLVVADAEKGSILATLPIGEGTDGAEFDPKRNLAFSSNREGTLSIIAEKSPGSFVPQSPVATQFGARTMALDPESGRLYLIAADFTLNPKATAADPRHRYTITPGTARLLFLDPAPR